MKIHKRAHSSNVALCGIWNLMSQYTDDDDEVTCQRCIDFMAVSKETGQRRDRLNKNKKGA